MLHEVRAVLDAAEAAARSGAWVLGWLRYEAAPAFDLALAVQAATPRCPWPGLRRTMRRCPGPPQRQRQTMRASTGTPSPSAPRV
jgi:para-aminobenzoate synthetase/4-amino-4-deoxychorismate lyase